MFAAGLAGAVAAGVAVPALFGSAAPAYAVTKNPDGSINLKVYEFRDAGQVEEELARWGVTADITYLPLGKRCGNDRASFLPGDQAIRPKDGITIYPRHIKPGQIALIEVMQNENTGRPGVAWQFSGRLTGGPVKPCEVVDDPSAHEIGDATPPPGG